MTLTPLRAVSSIDHGELESVLPNDGGDAADTLASISTAGVHLAELGANLQAGERNRSSSPGTNS